MAEPILVAETGAGLSDSNSYVTLVEAEILLSSRPDTYKTLWTATDDYGKEQVLIWATALLDDWIIWPGIATTPHQALGFPRSGVLNPDGYVLPPHTVYAFVKRATVEMALTLLASDASVEPTRGLNLIKVGQITLDFNQQESQQVRVVQRSVFAILLPYGCRMRSIGGNYVGSLALERA